MLVLKRTCGEGECCRKVVVGGMIGNSRSSPREGPINCKLGRWRAGMLGCSDVEWWVKVLWEKAVVVEKPDLKP
jgi:hypothetical protein